MIIKVMAKLDPTNVCMTLHNVNAALEVNFGANIYLRKIKVAMRLSTSNHMKGNEATRSDIVERRRSRFSMSTKMTIHSTIYPDDTDYLGWLLVN